MLQSSQILWHISEEIRKESRMTIKRLAMLVLVLISTVGLGNSIAYAASLCVQPSGAGHCFTSIQGAVDAANTGDRIIIRAGKYTEQVTINGKDLELVGRSGAVLQAPADMQDTQSPVAGNPDFEARPILLVTNAEVTVRDLTIDGLNSAENNPVLEGIAYINAGGVIRGNVVRNMGFGEPRLPLDANGAGVYQGDGIVVVNLSSTPRTITIAENRIINYNNNGIIVDAEADPNNPQVPNLTAQVIDNTVIALGPNEVIDQWGIFIGGFGFADPQSSITGTVRGNRIRDLVTVGSYPLPGVGIVTFNPYNLEITDNTIDNANVGMAANQAFGAQIIDNQFTGPSQDVSISSGILLSGTDSVVSENRFKKFGLGVLLMIEDPAFGSALNTSLDDNRFDNVTVDLLTGSVAPAAAAARAVPAPAWIKSPRR
jgi:hypothetical protein